MFLVGVIQHDDRMAFGSWLKYIEIKCWSLEVLTHYSMRCGSTWWNVERRPATSTNIQKHEKWNRIHWYSLAIPVPWGKWNPHPLHGMVEWPWSLLNGDHHCQINRNFYVQEKTFSGFKNHPWNSQFLTGSDPILSSKHQTKAASWKTGQPSQATLGEKNHPRGFRG